MAWRLARVALLILAGFVVTPLAIEGLARLVVKQQQTDSCQKLANHGTDFTPNCISRPMKLPEGPWIHDVTNECGWRTRESCRTKRPNQLRVSVLGTSIARGLWVDYPSSWAARATTALSDKCRRPVDFQNLAFNKASAGFYPLWDTIPESRLQPALDLQPDALVVIFAANDLLYYQSLPQSMGGPAEGPSKEQKASRGLVGKLKSIKQNFKDLKSDISESSVAINVFRQWYQKSPERYSFVYSQTPDFADYLRQPLTPAWQLRLKIVDHVFSDIGASAQRRHVPWIVFYIPPYSQAAVAAHRVAGEDAYRFSRYVQDIVQANGGQYVDATSSIAREPHLEDDYYVVDGHPNLHGEELISNFVVSNLIAKAPAFAGCA